MTRPLDRTQRIFRALWIKALNSPTPVPLKFDTYAQAMQMRLSLYRFGKPYRNNATLDPELYEALQKIAVSCPPKPGKILMMKPKVDLTLAELAMMAAELSEEDLVTEAEREMMKLSVKEKAPQPVESAIPGTGPVNPFFNREEL